MPKRSLEAASVQPDATECIVLITRALKALLERKPHSQFIIGGQMSKEPIYRVHIHELGEYFIIYPNANIADVISTEVKLPDFDPDVLVECMTEHWDDIDVKRRDLVKMFKALRDKKVIID